MTIFKAKNSIEEYKFRSFSKDINELSGRTGRKELTQFVNKEILKVMNKYASNKCDFIDIGCGDGSLIDMASNNLIFRKIIGISPNQEEVDLISSKLKLKGADPKIKIIKGLSTDVPLYKNSFDFIVINGVLLILENKKALIDSLLEIKRISRLNAYVYIGEMPFIDESINQNYGDSIIKWLFYTLQNKGVRDFFIRFKQVLKSFISNEPFIISRKKILFYKKEDFIALVEDMGFKLVFAELHTDIHNNRKYKSKSRNNYLFINISKNQ